MSQAKDEWGEHECRAPGCKVVIGKSLLMCRHHWLQVPRHFRHQLERLFSRWSRGHLDFEGVKAMRDAQQRCIDSLTALSSDG